MEMKFKGTPGPWKICRGNNCWVEDKSGKVEIAYTDMNCPDDECVCNACLIAAAPELLEVCVKLCAFCTEVATMSQTDDKSGAEEVGRKIGNLYGDAYRAIMKALGE